MWACKVDLRKTLLLICNKRGPDIYLIIVWPNIPWEAEKEKGEFPNCKWGEEQEVDQKMTFSDLKCYESTWKVKQMRNIYQIDCVHIDGKFHVRTCYRNPILPFCVELMFLANCQWACPWKWFFKPSISVHYYFIFGNKSWCAELMVSPNGHNLKTLGSNQLNLTNICPALNYIIYSTYKSKVWPSQWGGYFCSWIKWMR